MKQKLILLPIFIILLLSFATAQLTYSTTLSNVVVPNINGAVNYNDNLVLFLSNGSAVTLNSTLDITSVSSTILGGQPLTLPATDNTYIYVVRTDTTPDRIYKLDPTSDFSVVSYQNTPVTQVLSMGYNVNNGKLLIGYGSGLAEYTYSTGVLGSTTTYSELDASYSDQYTILTPNGDNFYLGIANETLQINTNLDIVQDMKPVVNFKTGYGYVNFQGYYLQVQTPFSNDLYKYTSSGEVTSDYTYLNGVFYSSNQCIDTGSEYDYIFCNNSYIQEFTNYDVAYCYSLSEETICEGICVTTSQEINGSTYVSGACDPSDCTNECLTIGTAVSSGLTSYRVCGNYDNDICLEYGTTQTCDSGEYYHLDPTSTNPYCSEYNYSSYNTTFLNANWYSSINQVSEVIDYSLVDTKTIVQTYLAVMNLASSYSPLVSDNNQYFKSRYLQQAYNVHTALNIGIVDLGIIYPDLVSASGYASVTCDHKETPIVESIAREELNTSRTLTTNLNKNIVTTSLTYTLNDTDDMRQTFKRVAPSLDHVVDLNVTNQTISVYSNGVVILNQTTANPLSLVNLYCDYDFTNLLRSCKVYVSDGASSYESYETPVSFSGSSTPASTYLSITPSDTISLTGYSVTSIEGREGFTSFNEGTYPFSCSIIEGGQVIRVYQNNGNIPSYLDFKDTYLNVDLGALTTTSEGTQNGLFGEDLSTLPQTTKFVISILTILILVILVMVVSSSEGINPTLSIILGSVITIGGLLFFITIGWLPVYVAIVIFILTASVGAIILRKGVTGA